MSDPLTLVLTFGHIFFAIGWLGAALVSNFTLGPLMMGFSPATRRELIMKFFPRFARIVAAFAGLTVLFGIGLYADLMQDSPGMDWMRTLGIGIILAVIAFSIGVGIVLPGSLQMPKLLEETDPAAPPSPAFGRALRRVQVGSMVSMLLLIGTLAFMVSAAGI